MRTNADVSDPPPGLFGAKHWERGARALEWSRVTWSEDAATAMPNARRALESKPEAQGPPLRVVLARSHARPWAHGPEEHILSARPADDAAGAVVEVAAASPAAFRHAGRALQRLVQTGLTHEVRVHDWPTVPRRGLMECFYGPTWSPQDRRWLIGLASDHGMNTYCYGPAEDALTGTRWRDLYTDEQLREFAALVTYARERGVEFVWRVSPCAPLQPSAGMVMSDPNEVDVLVEKCRQLLAVGVRAFLIAFDDLDGGFTHEADESQFGTGRHAVAYAHAQVTNSVWGTLTAADPSVSVTLCPTDYWGVGPSPYRARLGELLDPSVNMCWTGSDVVAPTITGAEAASVQREVGNHRLWLWDNYPVNDWGGAPVEEGGQVNTDLLFLGPLLGREADLARCLWFYGVQGAIQAAATAPALIAAARWTWAPETYDAEAVWNAAVDNLDDGEGSLRVLASLHRTSRLDPRAGSELAARLWQYLSQLDGGVDATAAAADLTERLHEAETAADAFAESRTRMARAIRPWAVRLRYEARVALLALQLLEALRTGASAEFAALAPRFRSTLDKQDQRGHPLVADGVLGTLIDRGRIVAGTGQA